MPLKIAPCPALFLCLETFQRFFEVSGILIQGFSESDGFFLNFYRLLLFPVLIQ
jgi:hypothetical protein